MRLNAVVKLFCCVALLFVEVDGRMIHVDAGEGGKIDVLYARLLHGFGWKTILGIWASQGSGGARFVSRAAVRVGYVDSIQENELIYEQGGGSGRSRAMVGYF